MNNSFKVSVIIPSYNRFNYLLRAIDSVISQNYKDLEIIVINDGSEDENYYKHKFDDIVKIVHLEENQKKLHGFGPGGIRNFGVNKAQGRYLAFLDDDDIWLPNKLEIQIKEMQNEKLALSSTEGYYGEGIFNPEEKYKLYNKQHYFKDLKYIYKDTKYLVNGNLPRIWDYEFTKVHNCFITSSVIVERKIFNTLGGFRNLPRWADYDCWLGLQQLTKNLYIDEPLFYYDGLHGDGRNYIK
tara:strand:+ start:992 stop:1714 length:723 start_codon:yes stop_codon:yes gene_type:complete